MTGVTNETDTASEAPGETDTAYPYEPHGFTTGFIGFPFPSSKYG